MTLFTTVLQPSKILEAPHTQSLITFQKTAAARTLAVNLKAVNTSLAFLLPT